MSKKNIVLVLILCIFFTVMSISLWGKNPEGGTVIQAESIIFYNNVGEVITEEHSEELHEKVIHLTKDGDNPQDISYDFSLDINPENTTDPELTYVFGKGEATITEVIKPDSYKPSTSISTQGTSEGGDPVHTVHYHFHIEFTIEEQELTQINFTFNKKTKSKQAYLMFKWTEVHEQEIPD